MQYRKWATRVLMVVAVGSHAQPAEDAKSGTHSAAEQKSTARTVGASDASKSPQDNQTNTAKDGKVRSPYDYQSSEEISEDRSVSFPVDI